MNVNRLVAAVTALIVLASCALSGTPAFRVENLGDAIFAISLEQGTRAYAKERRRGAHVLLVNEQLEVRLLTIPYANSQAVTWSNVGLSVLGIFDDYLIADQVQKFPRPKEFRDADGSVFTAVAKGGGSLRFSENGKFDSPASYTNQSGITWMSRPGLIRATANCGSGTYGFVEAVEPDGSGADGRGMNWIPTWQQLSTDGVVSSPNRTRFTPPIPLSMSAAPLPQPCLDDTTYFVCTNDVADFQTNKEEGSVTREGYLATWNVKTGEQHYFPLRTPTGAWWREVNHAGQSQLFAGKNPSDPFTLWDGESRLWSVTKTGVVTELPSLVFPPGIEAQEFRDPYLTDDYLVLAAQSNLVSPGNQGFTIAIYDRNAGFQLVKTLRTKPGRIAHNLEQFQLSGFAVKPGALDKIMKG